MARDWERDFRAWSRPPTATEEKRCNNAESVVRNAIKVSEALSRRRVEVFAQGSYRNETNVRVDSDVDICVRCMDVCFYDLPNGVTPKDVGLVDATYTYSQFKADVEQALRDYLGQTSVTRGNKALDLHENSYRVDADVVPTFEHRRYHRDSGGRLAYLSGTELRPDRGGRVINWPHQHYHNGVQKNKATARRFKRVVRVIKRLRNEMAENGMTAAHPVPSYLIECLLWNVPNSSFGNETFTEDLRSALMFLYGATKDEQGCHEWGEINELKYLFRSSQPWTIPQAQAFVVGAWNYVDLR